MVTAVKLKNNPNYRHKGLSVYPHDTPMITTQDIKGKIRNNAEMTTAVKFYV